MSAHTTIFTVKRDILFFTIVLFVIVFSLFPQYASADTLPVGVLERQSCGAISLDIYAYGAGLMHNPNTITTTNGRVSYISPTENCAVIEWDTENPAATQVLFTELSNEPVQIDLSIDPDFGYSQATVQNNAGVAHHVAILTGLEAGKAYSYRLVSRSHPTALPSIQDAQVFIAGPTAVTYTPPAVTPTIPITPPSSPTTPTYNAEKFPITPRTSTETEIPTTSGAATSEASTTVPSALGALTNAFGAVSREGQFWSSVKDFFAGLGQDKGWFSLSPHFEAFEKGRYIVPTIFFLALFFLLQQLVLPAFNIDMKNPFLYWLVGSLVLSIISATFMLYYISLIAIALFLGVLAWYLLESIPEVMAPPSKEQPKLLAASKGTPPAADKTN